MTIPRGALRKLVIAETPTEESDTQVARVAEIIPTNRPPNPLDIARNTTISEVFGEAILNDADKVNAIVKAQNELGEDIKNLLGAALRMGRTILELKGALSGGEFTKALSHSPKIFRGMTRGTVQKLMTVAEWVDSGRLPMAMAPQHYTILYEFTTLREDELRAAIEQNLFRPDVTRNEVSIWKKRIGRTLDQPRSLQDEYDDLSRKRRDYLGSALDARKRMKEIRDILANSNVELIN